MKCTTKEKLLFIVLVSEDTSDRIVVSKVMAIHFDFGLHLGRRTPQVRLVDDT